MIWAAPWALLGLAALPLIWWLHKKLRRPPDIQLPSLMFLDLESEARALPRGRRFDTDLLLALAATALLAFAAAGPSLGRSTPQRVVRVVVSGGGGSSRKAYLRDVEAALGSLRAALGEDGVVQATWLPARAGDGFYLPRSSDEALLGAVWAGPASARLVLSDRAAPADLAGVTWVALGRTDVENTSIVSVSVGSQEGVPELFVTLAHQGAQTVRGHVSVRVTEMGTWSMLAPAAFELAPGGYGAVRIPLGAGAGGDMAIALTDAESEVLPDTIGEYWNDELSHDDGVDLLHGPLSVGIDYRLPKELAARIRHALAAVLGPQGFAETDAPRLRFVPRGRGRGGLHLELETLAEGAPATRAPSGGNALGSDPLVRDLTTEGGAWIYAQGAERIAEGEQVLLGRAVNGTTWPVVLRSGGRIRLAPDPLRGKPRPVDTAFWPLLIQNLVDATGDARVGGGYRAVGLLDARSSAFGVTRSSFDPAALVADLPAQPGPVRPLRPLLILAALLCLALLWTTPRLRRRLELARAVRANPRSHA